MHISDNHHTNLPRSCGLIEPASGYTPAMNRRLPLGAEPLRAARSETNRSSPPRASFKPQRSAQFLFEQSRQYTVSDHRRERTERTTVRAVSGACVANSHTAYFAFNRSIMLGLVSGLLLFSGCAALGPEQSPTEYGAVIMSNDLGDIPADVSWVNMMPGPFIWGEIQTAPDQAPADWSWQAADALVQRAEARQVKIIATIWPYALWDQAACHGDWTSTISLLGEQFAAPYPPCDVTAYTTWVQAVVARYSDTITTWQILRLPEQQTAPFANFIGSAQQYAELAATTTAAIISQQPDATILAGTIGRPTSATISFWGPILERADTAQFTHVAITAANSAEWASAQTWLARYQWPDKVWFIHVPTRDQLLGQTFEGAGKVLYTVRNE